jgi:hypothetical protein
MNDLEKRFYEIAGQEIASKTMVSAIATKAFSDAAGDEKRTLARYIELRVKDLEDEYIRVADQQERSARADKGDTFMVTCPQCHKMASIESMVEFRGNKVLFGVLALCGILPGFVYWRVVGDRLRCPWCRTIVKERD